MTPNQTLAVNMRRLRKASGWTQQDLADKLGWTAPVVSVAECSASEQHARQFSVDDLVLIAWALDVAPVELLAEVPLCGTCLGSPPTGFTCQECSAAGASPKPRFREAGSAPSPREESATSPLPTGREHQDPPPTNQAIRASHVRRKGHAMTAPRGWQYADFVTGPGAGKSMARAVSLVLSARGPVVAASRTSGLWADTAASRAKAGKTWLFDPCSITGEEQQFWMDPLGVVSSVETAHQLASHFALTVESRAERACWWPAAQTLLTALFLAASASGRTLNDVAQWLDQPSMPDPASALHSARYTALASGLVGAQNAEPQTRDGIYRLARAATQVIRDERVMRWVTPQPGLSSLDAASLLGTNDTLYLVSRRRSSVTPLVAAVINGVIRAGIQRGQQADGQNHPPGLILTDDAASIWPSNTGPTLRSQR